MAGFGDIIRRVRRRPANTPDGGPPTPETGGETPPAVSDAGAPASGGYATTPAASLNADTNTNADAHPLLPIAQPPPEPPPAVSDAGAPVGGGYARPDVSINPNANIDARPLPPIAAPPETTAAGVNVDADLLPPIAAPPPETPAAGISVSPDVDAGLLPPIADPPPPASSSPAVSPPETAPARDPDLPAPILLPPSSGSDYAGLSEPPTLEPPPLIAGDAPPAPASSSSSGIAAPLLAPPAAEPAYSPATSPVAPPIAPPDDTPVAVPPAPGVDDDAPAPAPAPDTASDDPLLLVCPYCGRPEQRVGARCEKCNGVIVRLPVWAQRRRRNWLARRMSWRRLIAACFIVLLILFVVWINYPFAPNPVVLFKNIQTQITIDDGPGAWSVAGRDLRHSRNVQVGPPPPLGNIDWQYPVPNPLRSEPVAQRNNIYVGSAQGIYPLAQDSGIRREQWEGDTPGRITAAAAVAENTLFFGSTDHTVNAWNALNGDVRWSFPAADTVEVAPVVSGGLVYISSGRGLVYALDAHNGNLIWQEQLDSNASAAVAIHDGKLFVGDERGAFYILSARTGQEHFRYRTARAVSGSPVVSADGLRVYFASGGDLYAIDAQAREVPGLYQFKQIWAQLWLWQVPGVPRPQGQQGDIWRFTPDNPLQGIFSSPALAEDADSGHKILYAGAHDHRLYALNATHASADNRLLWTFEAEEAIWASPLVVKDRVIFGDDAGNVYSLDRLTGQLDWRINLGAAVRIPPIVSNDLLIIRTNDGIIHGIK